MSTRRILRSWVYTTLTLAFLFLLGLLIGWSQLAILP